MEIHFNAPDALGSWGSLLSGIGTMILVGFSTYATISYGRWRNEKSAEKKSLIAEESLNHLESSLDMAVEWLNVANSWLIYSRYSNPNITQDALASDEIKKIRLKNYSEDPYEVHNYCRSFNGILKDFIIAKNRALRLKNNEINQNFESIHTILKTLPSKIMRIHRIDLPSTEKDTLTTYLESDVLVTLEAVLEKIRSILHRTILLDS